MKCPNCNSEKLVGFVLQDVDTSTYVNNPAVECDNCRKSYILTEIVFKKNDT